MAKEKQNGHWAEINESIARELGWVFEFALGWKSPGGKYARTFPDYIGDVRAIWEIMGYCHDRKIDVLLYSQNRPLETPYWICTLWCKNTVRAEAVEATLAIGKAFLILRRQDVTLQNGA